MATAFLWDMVKDTVAKVRSTPLYPAEWDNLPALHINGDGFLEGEGVQIIKAHPSWHYARLSTATGDPLAIVAHSSETNIGSAVNMAKNRARPRDPEKDRPASWHLSIEPALIVQMISLEAGAWHAPSLIKGVGSANRTAAGIEMIGYHNKPFQPAAVANAARAWRAIVRSYGIKRSLAMLAHSALDPARRKDPGKDFMTVHAPAILAYAYAA